MKKHLLLLILLMPIVCITNAQTQGHSWTFNSVTVPFISTPAIAGFTGTHPLTTIVPLPTAAFTIASETVGLGASCGAPISVGSFSGYDESVDPDPLPFEGPLGFHFANNGEFVSTVYTIEMTVRFSPTGNYSRLIGFTDLLNPGTPGSTSDYGIYLDPTGLALFYKGNPATGEYIGANPLLDDVWYHLTFVRDGNNIISYYINGVLQGIFDDSGNDLLPQVANNFDITFFKDEGTEEDAGQIAKLSIYNRALTQSEIVKTFDNICNTSLLLPATPSEGYQWALGTSLVSNAAVAGSTGSYTLATIGAGSFTPGTSEDVGIGESCTGNVNVASFVKSIGLNFENNPRYVYDTYSIEMVINLDPVEDNTYRRLVGFTDLAGALGDNGIYLDPDGSVFFYNGGAVTPIGPQLAVSTWYHLTFVRASDDIISYYLNGSLIATTYNDNLKEFLPQTDGAYSISFLKDDTGNETSGMIAKIGIFNTPLALTDVQERFNTICNTALVVLPVSLKSFTAVKADSQVELIWTTSSEQNNLGFEVQRSNDGINFTAIGFVNGNGTTTQEHTYHFTDQSPSAGKSYYRLKQIDIDNRATYSSIRSIEMDKDQQRIQLFPNPSRSLITITNINAGNQMSVFNSQGNLILRKIASSGQESISVEKFAAGVYLLQVTDSDNNKRTIRFSKF